MKKIAVFCLAIVFAGSSFAQSISYSAQGGENIDAGMAVNVRAAGTVFKAIALDPENKATGFCQSALAIDGTGDVYVHGVVDYDTGANPPGTVYYLSSTAGVITETKPTGSYQQVGVVIYGGKLYVSFQPRIIPTWEINRITSNTSPQTLTVNVDNLIDQGGTQAAFTFKLPASPTDGDFSTATFNNIVTALTIDGNGTTVSGASITTAAIGTCITYKYYDSASSWIRIK
ncbi:MAG: hypothetical protein FD130_1637 [Halothiobacillaceae bacterium]|nr:MAG: hypothetical protein FD130_1637 [Halothiobacillaceae bacterium]